MSDIINSSAPTLGDVIQWEVNELYTRTSGTFRNNTGSTDDFPIGQVVNTSGGKYVPANGPVSGVYATGILLTPVDDLANNTDTTVAVLYQGPAVVNYSQLAFEHAGTAEEDDAWVALMVADLAALGIKVIEESSEQATL